MTMMSIYLFSKKIHRLLVLVMTFLIVLMAGTGLVMKYSEFVSNNLSVINLSLARYIHNNLSVAFTIGSIAMAITGLFMYFIPYIQSKKAENEQNQVN